MSSINFSVNLDMGVVQRMAAGAVDASDEEAFRIAEEFEEDMRNSFGSDSPSQPGDPPAVVTGNLKNSIYSEHEAPGRWVVYISTDAVPYAAFLEFGTVKMAARPFFFPALYRAKKNLPRILDAVVQAAKD